MPTQHEVPTHLDVEDRVLFGLTARQFLSLLVGCSAAYSMWSQLASLPDAVRMGVVGLSLLITAAFALLRPAGRSLEEWLLAILVYVSTPRSSTWRPREPLISDWRPTGAGWQELTPSPVWVEEAEA